MRYVSGFFTFLVALLLLCSSVFASEIGMDDLPTDFARRSYRIGFSVCFSPIPTRFRTRDALNMLDSCDAAVESTFPRADRHSCGN